MFWRIFSRKRAEEEKRTLYRNFIFGVEDSLVSTVGMLSGVAAANTPRSSIVISGIVLIFVEAFSMGVGSFLSEETSGQLVKKNSANKKLEIKAAFLMFISYFIAGFVPLSPYIFVTDGPATILSICASLFFLVLLGLYSAHRFKGNLISKALEMFILGGFATVVGIAVGVILK